MELLRVDMKNENTAAIELPEEWLTIGGSGLIAKIMNDKVPPGTDPLGPDNKLIIACGPLAGTRAPQLGRISVGAKSPLTLGIKEANAGGPAGQYMDRLGFRGIIVENAAVQGKTFCLRISKEGARLVPADEFKGLNNYELVQRLHSKYVLRGRPTVADQGSEGQGCKDSLYKDTFRPHYSTLYREDKLTSASNALQYEKPGFWLRNLVSLQRIRNRVLKPKDPVSSRYGAYTLMPIRIEPIVVPLNQRALVSVYGLDPCASYTIRLRSRRQESPGVDVNVMGPGFSLIPGRLTDKGSIPFLHSFCNAPSTRVDLLPYNNHHRSSF